MEIVRITLRTPEFSRPSWFQINIFFSSVPMVGSGAQRKKITSLLLLLS